MIILTSSVITKPKIGAIILTARYTNSIPTTTALTIAQKMLSDTPNIVISYRLSCETIYNLSL